MPSNWHRRRQNRLFYPHSMRYGTRVGGMAIAFQCIIVLSFLGFGLTLIGTIMTATSYNDPLDENPFFAKHKNPVKIIGPIFLGFGLLLIFFSVILCILSVKTGRKLFEQERSAQPVQTNVNTYPSPQGNYQPYPSQQPVPPQGSYQPYPPQQPVPPPQGSYQPYPPQQPVPPPQGNYQTYPMQQPIQTDVNISPSPHAKGNYPPYPPQPGYQYVPNKEPTDLPPPYPISGKDASAPYTPPSYPAQPAYNPSAS